MSDAVLHQRLRLGCCPVPRKEDCLGCMGEARAEAMAAVREEVAAGGTLTKAPGSKPSLSWGTCWVGITKLKEQAYSSRVCSSSPDDVVQAFP